MSEPKDVYRAAVAYDLGIRYEDVTKEQRQAAKLKYFSYIYGSVDVSRLLPSNHPIRECLGPTPTDELIPRVHKSFGVFPTLSPTGRLQSRPPETQDPVNRPKPKVKPILINTGFSDLEVRLARKYGLLPEDENGDS